MCCDDEAGSYVRLIDSCITQLKAHGPSRACNESEEEEKKQTLFQNSTPKSPRAQGRYQGPGSTHPPLSTRCPIMISLETDSGGNVNKFAPTKAFKLIAFGHIDF